MSRDSFISNWQIPVDIGNNTIFYRFELKPEYLYKAKAIVYHESGGQWKRRVRIDNNQQFLINYNAQIPETLEFWIPPLLYQDGVLDVAFERITGSFAPMGPVYIYRYENDGGGGGPMSQSEYNLHNIPLTISPNPFVQSLNIEFKSQAVKEVRIKIYDVLGRLVKNLYTGTIKNNCILTWRGDSEKSKTVSRGIYFLQIENLDTGETFCRKVLKVE